MEVRVHPRLLRCDLLFKTWYKLLRGEVEDIVEKEGVVDDEERRKQRKPVSKCNQACPTMHKIYDLPYWSTSEAIKSHVFCSVQDSQLEESATSEQDVGVIMKTLWVFELF